MANIIIPSRLHSPVIGLPQLIDSRVKVACLSNTAKAYIKDKICEDFSYYSGSQIFPGYYGMGIYNNSTSAAIGGILELNSGLSDLLVIIAVNNMSSSYGSQMSLLWTGGDSYGGGIRIQSFYDKIDAIFKEVYSGNLIQLSSVGKGIPGIVAFRRRGINIDLTVRYTGGGISQVSSTDTVRNVRSGYAASGIYLGGINIVSSAFIIEGTVDDVSLVNYMSNPYSIYSHNNFNFKVDTPASYIGDQPTPWADQGGSVQMGG